MKFLHIILVSVIAYLVANTSLNFGGRPDPWSMLYAVPLVAAVLVACQCLFVEASQTQSVDRFERGEHGRLPRGGARCMSDLRGHHGQARLVRPVRTGAVGLWLWAKALLPAHAGLVVGAAFGLVITLESRGLASLLVPPVAGLIFGVIGYALSSIHEPLAHRLADSCVLAGGQ